MKTATHYTVLTPTEFIEDVTAEAEKAQKRVYAQAMDVEPGKIADTFFSIFPKAAQRGIDTRFHADHYSLMVTEGYFHYWPFVSPSLRKTMNLKRKAKEELAETFRNSGVKLRYTNPPTLLDRSFPVRGRNHMKLAVVDDVAWIGGVNFVDANFLADDVMVKLTDPLLVREIAYVFTQIDAGESLRDMAIDCTSDTKLLVDGGRINRSLILRHAVELIEKAEKEITLITPLIPDADLLHALKQAQKRNISLMIILPRSVKMRGIYQLLDEFNAFMLRLRGGKLPITFKNHMIHAKILIVDGQQAIVGSHNFSSRGVRMGTEEIALHTTNKTLIENLTTFFTTLQKST